MKKEKHIDNGIFEEIKEFLPPNNSVGHEAAIWANGIMNYGTSDVELLKKNLEWVAKASNWEKFAATISLGMI